MSRPLRLLLVEDSADDAELLLRELGKEDYDLTWLRVETPAALQDAMQETWDIIIADYSLPNFNALDALEIVKSYNRDIPFIIVSGTVGEEAAVGAMKAGAHDYIIKGRWARLIPAISRELTEAKIRRENQQAQIELEARARDLALLNDITRTAASMLDFDEMLHVLADRLGELLEADGCYITLWDELKQRAIPVAAYGPLQQNYIQLVVEPDEKTLTAAVIKAGRPIAITDVLNTPYISPRISALFPTRGLLGLPLIVGNDKLGAILISFNEPHEFTQSEIVRSQQAAGQIALAVSKARLLNSERKQRDLAETLREITHVLTSSLEQDEVLNLILDELNRVLIYESASVYGLVDDELHRLILRTAHDQTDNPVLSIAKFRHIVDVLSSRKPLIIDDTVKDSRWQTLLGKTYTRCWMGVPLIAHNEVIGLLNITHSIPYFYTEPDAEVALAFANQAATAIENARLYERLRHYAQDLEAQVNQRTHELANANEQLKELDRLKTKFVSDVSHELRTPVTNLKLYLSLLERGAPQQRERYLGVISEQTERLEELIRDILDISRLETDADQMIFQPVNLNDLVDHAIASHKKRAELSGLQLNFQPDYMLPLVDGDATKLRQVAENLLTNAIHYTLSGMVNVNTYADWEAKKVCLQISDTGIGIADEELPFLFDRFYRGERTSRSNIPGTGLGLSIVKEIVDMHNGRIEIESKVNEGTTFQVWLPASSEAAFTDDIG